MLRVQNLQKELSKELREGEKYLTLVNMNDLIKDSQQSLIMQANAKLEREEEEQKEAND